MNTFAYSAILKIEETVYQPPFQQRNRKEKKLGDGRTKEIKSQ